MSEKRRKGNHAYMSISDNKPTRKANAHPLRHICLHVSAKQKKTDQIHCESKLKRLNLYVKIITYEFKINIIN